MIAKLIGCHALDLEAPEHIHPEALLWAIYDCERYPKHNKVPRFEAAYTPVGYSYQESDLVRREYQKWGNWAACSYSNFQIMYITAVELGYTGPPLALDKDSVALEYVVKFLNDHILKSEAVTLSEIADAYNRMSCQSTLQPEHYVNRFKVRYKQHLKRCSTTTTETTG